MATLLGGVWHPQLAGNTIVVVEATADGKSVTDDFKVDVEDSKPKPPPPPAPAPTVAPTVTTEIANMELYLVGDAEGKMIDLSRHFAHEDAAAEITYSAKVRGNAVDAEVGTDGKTLTVTPVLTGPARVTVTATVGDKSIASSFMVTVKPGSKAVVPKVPPAKLKPIPTQTLYQADGAKTIDLTEHFSHKNEITYPVPEVRGDAVDASIDGDTLTLTPVLPDSARVTVTATADGMSSSYNFLVTVIAGSKPLPEAIKPKGTISAVSVEAAASTTKDVAGYFTVTADTYAAASSDDAKATASASGSVVTITGVAAGSATVTVTATDSHSRKATQTIAVTVTPAGSGAKYKPNTVPIEGKGKKYEDYTIDEGQTLVTLDPSIVSVSRQGTTNKWTLTGVGKGTGKVSIRNANRTEEKKITVTVANTPPKATKIPTGILTIQTGSEAATPTASAVAGKDGGTAPSRDNTSGKRRYHKLLIPTDIFTDADGPADIVKPYKITSSSDLVDVVKELHNGVVLDVTGDTNAGFQLTASVKDKDGEESDDVTLSVRIEGVHKVLAESYKVNQNKTPKGAFTSTDVYRRENVMHKLTVTPVGDSDDGFEFVKDYETRQFSKDHTGYKLWGGATADYGTVTTEPQDIVGTLTHSYTGPKIWITYTTSGPIKVKAAKAQKVNGNGSDSPAQPDDGADGGFTFASDVPTLEFEVDGTGPASVTFTLHRLIFKPAAGGREDRTAPIDGDEIMEDTDTETLSFTVVASDKSPRK